MIRHFVIFTFEKDFFHDENMEEFKKVFAQLEKDVDGVISAQVHKNVVDRPANMDLMVIMDLADESVLGKYLNHPAHIAMGEKYNSHVVKRVSFDYSL